MAFESTELAEGLLNSLLESDQKRREAQLQAWLDSTIPQLQEAVARELKGQVQRFKEVATTPEGWKPYFKWSKYTWNLVLEVKFRNHPPTIQISQPTNETAARAASQGDCPGDLSPGGRSANDDRSDSMNPNNSAHQASVDNRSDQMNPNNSAYWSSRGGGRGR